MLISPSAAWRRIPRTPSSTQAASSGVPAGGPPRISERSSAIAASIRSWQTPLATGSSSISAAARFGSEAPTGPSPPSTERSARRWSLRPSIADSRPRPISKRSTAQASEPSGSGLTSSALANSARLSASPLVSR